MPRSRGLARRVAQRNSFLPPGGIGGLQGLWLGQLGVVGIQCIVVGRLTYVAGSIDMSTSTLLEQVLDPFVECLTLEAARTVVDLRAAPEVQ